MTTWHAELTVIAAARLWLAQIERDDFAEATVRQYRGSLARYVERHEIAGMTLAQANNVPTLETWLREIAEQRGLGAAAGARKVLRGTIALAVRYGVLPTNAFGDVRMPRLRPKPRLRYRADGTPREPRQPDRSFTDAERSHVMAVADRSRVARRLDLADMIAFMAGTGVRIGEAVGQRWEDTDLAAGTVHVRGTKTKASDRLIHLPEWLVSRLEDRLRRLEKLDAESGTCLAGTGVVFHSPNTTGRERPRDRDNAINGIRRVLDEAGLEWATPHSFRHTAITRILEAGFDIGLAADHAGHADVRTTQSYIGRRRDTRLAATAL